MPDMTDAPEEWRPIPTWEKYYLASNLGRVWSIRLGRCLKQAIKKQSGRAQVTLMVSPRRQDCLVSDLVCMTFRGDRPEGLHCLHFDGDVTNNAAANLHWGSVSENIFDEVRHGTHRNARKTHCPRQHPYVPGNTFRNNLGNGSVSRNCKSCCTARTRMKDRGWWPNPDLFKKLADEYADKYIPGWRMWTPEDVTGQIPEQRSGNTIEDGVEK